MADILSTSSLINSSSPSDAPHEGEARNACNQFEECQLTTPRSTQSLKEVTVSLTATYSWDLTTNSVGKTWRLSKIWATWCRIPRGSSGLKYIVYGTASQDNNPNANHDRSTPICSKHQFIRCGTSHSWDKEIELFQVYSVPWTLSPAD